MYRYIVIVILLVIVFGIFIVFKFSRKKKLTKHQKKRFSKNLIQITKLNSPKEKIIDFDKLYHLILKGLGYKGTFGEILKSKPREITNLNKIWELHKLRNKLVHEFNNQKESILDSKCLNYEREVMKLLR